MKYLALVCFAVLSYADVAAQNVATWNGKLLGVFPGQSKAEVAKRFRNACQTEKHDDLVTEYYYLSADSTAFIGVTYKTATPNVVYAVQVTGYESTPALANISLGDNSNRLSNTLGKPVGVQPISFHSRSCELWEYPVKKLSFIVKNEKVYSMLHWKQGR